MTTYRIDSFEVQDLWGYKDFDFHFDPDVNILIGLNASGKTTLLKLLHSIFSADFRALREIDFSRIRVGLRSFDGESRRTVKIETTESGFECTISNKTFQIDLERFVPRREVIRTAEGRIIERVPRSTRKQFAEASTILQNLVPTVWLPVSRRLPISEEEYPRTRLSEFERRAEIDSVDVRLRELSDELTKYRLRLDARLSERYKEFEKRVLGIILYSKEADQIGGFTLEAFSSDEKELLLEAFKEAGLLDNRMQKRIEQHFSVAEEVVHRLSALQPGESSSDIDSIADISILPLIPRTRDMIGAAQNLEEEREVIFFPMHTYEAIVSSFFNDKTLSVLDNGEIEIRSLVGMGENYRQLPTERLSSGEKQILILLTQALLEQEHPVVYLADEPELSLHVSWQEKLLQSLDTLGGQTQIIVATHSPDIVGPFSKNVIDLAAKN